MRGRFRIAARVEMFTSSTLLRVTRPAVSSRQLSSDAAGKQRISLALYRQLLRWCNETDDGIPLPSFVPPVYMTAPQMIDANSLESLSEEEKSKFPANSIIETGQVTCPIHNSADARNFFRAIFRLNREQAKDADIQKQRITLAFEGIRSLNELSRALKSLKQNRAKHVLRDGLKFRVGQVVKHKVEDWRGIVIGWQRFEPDTRSETQSQPTSLTQKSYEVDPVDAIRYTVLLDSGDAHLHYSKRRETQNLSQAQVFQSDLQLVEDESLLRIRSTRSAQYFDHFNPISGTFVPNEIMAYEYPEDVESSSVESLSAALKSDKAAGQIISGVEDMGDHLRRVILDYTSAPESRKLKILATFLDRILKLSSGDVLPMKDRLAAGSVSEKKRAAHYLQHLISLSEDIGELLWQRRRYLEAASSFEFSVGDVVRHKKYGFRGVIVASDPEPSVDVSRWDGLQHIKNPEMYPFYHIIADRGDTINAFGAERPSRYVCQANLEICPLSERKIDVDLEPEWEYNSAEGMYTLPEDLKFKYGRDLGDDGLTKQCLVELRDSLTRTLVAMRDGAPTGTAKLDAVAQKLSVDNLMHVLRDSQDLDTSTTISDSLKEIWRAHNNGDLKDRLDTAIGALLGGKTERALALFTDLIDEDPNYAEAWNKASTCEFMLGNLDASLAAAQKTLEIIPTHFQAQNGLGLVYYEKKELPSAVDSFRKSLELDPWSPVSARLSLCLDTLEKWKKSPGPKVVE